MKAFYDNIFFTYSRYFLKYLGHRIFIGILLSILVGLFDGLGLALFLPLFYLLDNTDVVSPDTLGNLRFIIDWLAYLGLSLNLTSVLGFLISVYIFKGAVKFFESYYNIVVFNYFMLKIRKTCIKKFSEYSYKQFVKADAGRIQNTLSSEVIRVAHAFSAYRSVLQNLIFICVYIGLAFISNPQFSIFILIGGALSNLIYKSIYKKTKKISKSITNFGHSYHGLLLQSVSYFKYLKSTSSFKYFETKLYNNIENLESSNKRLGVLSAILLSAREPIIMIIISFVIYFQVTFFDQSIKVLMLSLMFFYRSLNFLMGFQTSWNTFIGVYGALENMSEFTDELQNNKEQFGHVRLDNFKSHIIFQNLFFSYQQDDWILKNVNLTIPKNSTIAFIGESGSGKTTLVNILTGLLPINSGTYTIDDIDSKEIDMRTLQNRIGYITQEPVIFDDSVFNNVTFWDEKTPENVKKFWEALRKASILEFVETLPEKENAPLGNNGVMISGGQKQRLSIARELYKDIDILIMDEATSALDSETERAIQENIDALKGHYTIIIIAHRLSTIKNADEIVLMVKGEIVDNGSFSDLMSKNETFKRMVNLQEL